MTNDYITSMIRTWVPIVVGSLIAAAAERLGITDIDSAQVSTAVTGIIIAVYYAIVRYLEQSKPGLGVLLGRRAAPTYDAAPPL